MNKFIDRLEFRITILMCTIVIIWFVAYITNVMVIRKYIDIKVKNAGLEQQVIDYRWQLERVQYIIKCRGDE